MTKNNQTLYWQKIPYLAKVLLALGLIGGISLRMTIFLNSYNQDVSNTIWYIGIISYIIFFYIRLSIEKHRHEIYKSPNLIERLEKNKLTKEDAKTLAEVIRSNKRSNIKFNYMMWFILSIASLIGALLFV